MDFIKKTCLYLCFILLVMSIYKDLSSEIPSEDPNKYGTLDEYSTDFTIIKVKVQPGDTVLSIVEEVNGQIQESSIEKVMTDFKALNPTTNPYQLQTGNFYYFPLY
ncbi:MAG TPA: hypothetical protein VK119_08790 [Bacillota bacterium]|nr:hypothetical protein [Bacillota bacterium]